jgi:hypothetical protein
MAHVAAAFARMEHGVVQLPQAAVSVSVLTQEEPHCVSPDEHEPEHCPIVHTCDEAQAWPQLPQLAASFWVLVHAVPASLAHNEVPVGHAHIDCRHVVPIVHAVPQVPQFMLSVARSTHALPQALGVEPEHVVPPPASVPASGVGATPESVFMATSACSPPAHAAAMETSARADQALREPSLRTPIQKTSRPAVILRGRLARLVPSSIVHVGRNAARDASEQGEGRRRAPPSV